MLDRGSAIKFPWRRGWAEYEDVKRFSTCTGKDKGVVAEESEGIIARVWHRDNLRRDQDPFSVEPIWKTYSANDTSCPVPYNKTFIVRVT